MFQGAFRLSKVATWPGANRFFPARPFPPCASHEPVSPKRTPRCGALLGTSPVIIANESSAGIIEGARTGLSAIVVACLFVASVRRRLSRHVATQAFLTPVLSSIPRVATSVPLVLIGAFMMAPCRGPPFKSLSCVWRRY